MLDFTGFVTGMTRMTAFFNFLIYLKNFISKKNLKIPVIVVMNIKKERKNIENKGFLE